MLFYGGKAHMLNYSKLFTYLLFTQPHMGGGVRGFVRGSTGKHPLEGSRVWNRWTLYGDI